MIILMHSNCSLEDRMKIKKAAAEAGLASYWLPNGDIAVLEGENRCSKKFASKLKNIAGVKEIISTSKPYKLVSREFKAEDTVIRVGDTSIGGKEVVIMAGPCALESEEQLLQAALTVKECGGKILRAGIFKPRTSPYSYQGIGAEGLKIIEKVKEATGLLLVSEVLDSETLAMVYDYVDILQVGTRNMQNFSLLRAVGRSGKPVLLKRGMCATIEEWLLAAEYIVSQGNPHVILCERGIRTYEKATRNTLDLSAVPVVKGLTHLPVIVDPSHAAGNSSLVSPLARAAVAVGADGLLVEMHPDPQKALCDGAQSLDPEAFKIMTTQLQQIVKALGRYIKTHPVPNPVSAAAP